MKESHESAGIAPGQLRVWRWVNSTKDGRMFLVLRVKRRVPEYNDAWELLEDDGYLESMFGDNIEFRSEIVAEAE